MKQGSTIPADVEHRSGAILVGYGDAGHAQALEVASGDHGPYHDWALSLWNRMDRDGNGFLSRDELACDEFQQVLRSVIAPMCEETSASYGRAEIHLTQALNFLLRKADQNINCRLSFSEFKAFLRVLRNQREARERANLIFALFDLDGTNTIDREELKEIFRYFQGRQPTALEVDAAWSKLDPGDQGYATRASYARWLRTSADPVFRQLAPAGSDNEDEDDFSEVDRRSRVSQGSHAGDILLQKRRRRHGDIISVRPEWNPRFYGQDIQRLNQVSPKSERTYFSRPQSLPELSRYCTKHAGRLDGMRKALEKTGERPKTPVLSTDTNALPKYLPGRYEPGGSMRDRRGNVVGWMDAWQKPREIAHSIRLRPKPGSLTLRLPGRAPEWAVLGKDFEE